MSASVTAPASRGAARRHLADRAGRDGDADRPLGRRQDDPAQDHDGPVRADYGRVLVDGRRSPPRPRLAAADRRGQSGRPALRGLARREYRILRSRDRHGAGDRGGEARPASTTTSRPCRCATTGSSATWGARSRAVRSSACCWRERSTRARALLFMDEVTANLDPASEAKVMEAIRSLPITRVISAHRPGRRFYWRIACSRSRPA